MMKHLLNNVFIEIRNQEDWIKLLLILNSHLPNLNKDMLNTFLKFALDKPYYLYIFENNMNCVPTFVSKSAFYNLGYKELTLARIYEYDKQ